MAREAGNIEEFPPQPGNQGEQGNRDQNDRGENGLEKFGRKTGEFFGKVGKSFTKTDPAEGLMEEILAIKPMEDLNGIVKDGQNHTQHDIETTRDALQLFIDAKRTVLSQDLTRPSWGPKIRSRKFKRSAASKSSGGWLGFGRSSSEDEIVTANDRRHILEPNRDMHEQDEAISFNLEQSRRYHHFLWLYLGATLASVAIVIAALSVDYSILKEFWTQAMVDEFMMVPPELQGSVGLKALQVLFATIGIHLVLRHMPNWVVTAFTGVIFVMTVGMMIAIGFLYAHKTLPVNNQDTLAGETTETGGLTGALEEAGVDLNGPAAEETETSNQFATTLADIFGAENIAIIDAVGWLVALTMIFLVVASIGALFMLWAEHNIRNFILARDFKHRKLETERLRLAEAVALQIHPGENARY